MRESFYKLCAEDVTCARKLAAWKDEIDHWSDPSDSGWCRTIVTSRSFDIDRDHPAPWNGIDGKPKPWKEIYSGGVTFPAKEAWAKIKTWIQTNCHDSKKCSNGIGNWQSTVNAIDAKVKK